MSEAEAGLITPFPNNVEHRTESLRTTEDDHRAERGESSTEIPKISQFQEETEQEDLGKKNPFVQKVSRWGHERYPRSWRIIGRILQYIQGPNSPIGCPPLEGFLDRTWNVKGRSFDLYWEKYVLHFTHSLKKPWIFWPLAGAYIVSLAFFARANYFFTPTESFIDCNAVYWRSLDKCGLDGVDCLPFSNATFNFRCPAGCMDAYLRNIRTIGDQEAIYVPLVVGGGDGDQTYRGDSFLCAAGIHAGLISKSRGGCAKVSLVGSFTDFISSSAHGITTIPFPSVFPLSLRLSQTDTLDHCSDLRNEALAFDILVTALAFLVLRPKAIILFWSLVCIGYWHVNLFSDPAVPPDLSTAFGTFLPSLFICYGFWRSGFRYVLPEFSNYPIERLIWYLPAFWAGVLFNVVVAGIPIDRLVASDIADRPGALTALIICCLVVSVLALNQLRVIRKTGWLPFYLKWYSLGGLVLLVLALLPGLEFRLHHYFAAILVIPLTAFPTRLSAIYQAFCLGMFLNGAAKFGLDSILQTPAELRRDAPLGSELPAFLTNATNWNTSIPLVNQTLLWDAPPPGLNWDGFSLLVDDVERYVGTATNFSLSGLNASIPHFFRLAFQSQGTSGDFTKAAVWNPSGSWSDPEPGPS
ncbi:hypothetical protein FS842_005492 [Serendipita sp. 407]|nr:hypothetical protein FS842_005492 [Serendipita sp. 407]